LNFKILERVKARLESSYIESLCQVIACCHPSLEAEKNFSTNENFRENLKVDHFYLGFSWNENYNKTQHSHRDSSECSGS